MKNFFRFLMMAFLAATTMMNVACSDDDDEGAGPNSIVGTWVEDVAVAPYTLTINQAGTGVLAFTYQGTTYTQNFEYAYNETEQRLDIIGSDFQGTHFVVLTNTTMVLISQSTNGTNKQYQFIRQ